jgi:ferredoxin
MIVAEQKSLDQIKSMVSKAERVLVLGCGTCVTVCFSGGSKEVAVLASALRIASRLDGKEKVVDEATVQRQCEWEYIDPLKPTLEKYDMIVSLGCGIGVQALAERFPTVRVVPGLNTTMLGLPTKHGEWEERCQACGNCILDQTGGICPIARCSKQILNGPCGGSQNGKCEINPDVPCAWQLIYERMGALGLQDELLKVVPPKDWSSSRDGGPRKIVRGDLQLPESYKE